MLLGHLVALFFAHDFTKVVGLGQRISGKTMRNSHNIFLICNDAIVALKDGLQLRDAVVDHFLPSYATYIGVGQPRVLRPGAAKGGQCGEVFDRAWASLRKQLSETATLRLKYTDRPALTHQCVGEGVIKVYRFERKFRVFFPPDFSLDIIEDIKRLQAQDVKFDQPECLSIEHVELRHERISPTLDPHEWDEVCNGLVRNDNPRGVF